MKDSIRSSSAVAAVAAALLTLAPAATAQPPASSDIERPPTYADPDGRGLPLIEAVRLTLSHDPNLRLAEEDARAQSGIALEISGDFDWQIQGELAYQHEERELRDGVRRSEQERRDDLTIFNGETCDQADLQTRKAAQIEQALAAEIGDVRIDTDAILDLQLQAIERLISEIPLDQAQVLVNQWNLILESELLETRALAQANRDSCRESAAALARLGATPVFEEFDSASLSLRADRKLRNGVVLSPFLQGDYGGTQYIGKVNGFYEPVLGSDGRQVVDYGIPRERFVDFGGKNLDDLYTFRVGFDVAAPLLRGRGRAEAGAAEKAALESADAVALLVKHAAAESVRTTALSYWRVLAAQQRVAILERSVKDQERIVSLTSDLIAADILAQVDGDRSRASLANSVAGLESARQNLTNARHELLRVMGFDLEAEQAPPFAVGEFPVISAEEIARAAADASLLGGLDQRRYDLAAARIFSTSSETLAIAAKLGLRPRLDATAGVWSTATGEGSFSEGTNRWVAPSWSVGLSFEKPIGNNTAKGRLMQSEARLAQDQVVAVDIERQARISALAALRSLTEAVAAMAQADEAVALSENLVAAEQDMLNARQSSVLDSILTEQQTTSARLAQIEARLNVANLLTELRFASGTLVDESAEGPAVTAATLSTLPSGSASGGR